MQIQRFVFNPFQENTYILYDETGECVIVDPGCQSREEQKELAGFIEEKQLKPKLLLNTHCHIDHVLGNDFVKEKYGIPLLLHEKEKEVLESVPIVARTFGLLMEDITGPDRFVEEGDEIKFGDTVLKVIFTPGHSVGHISFFEEKGQHLFSGDVLFRQSIGRTDLPGGHAPTLLQSIRDKIIPLGEDVRVWPGHMEDTTIGAEIHSNPFLQEL